MFTEWCLGCSSFELLLDHWDARRARLQTARDNLPKLAAAMVRRGDSTVVSLHLTTMQPDVNGHYTFLKVPPGTYGVIALVRVDDRSDWLVAPAIVDRGKATTRDLDNSARLKGLACGRAPL